MHGMWNYFLRRILLVPVTFVIITCMVYTVMRLAPGGPIEQLERQLKMADAGEAGGGPAGLGGEEALDEDDKEELRQYYNLDSPIPIGYVEWLGVKPRRKKTPVELAERKQDPEFWSRTDSLWNQYRDAHQAFENKLQAGDWVQQGGELLIPIDDARKRANPTVFAEADRLLAEGVTKRSDLKEHLERNGYFFIKDGFFGEPLGDDRETDYFKEVDRLRKDDEANLAAIEQHLAARGMVVSRKTGRYYHETSEWSGIFQGDFGNSFSYNKPALEVIKSKFPISIYFGLIGFFASWLICVPLGALKAIQHRTHVDTATSIVVFLGYSVPGFVACMLLLVLFGGGSFWNWVPLGSFRDPSWNDWWQDGEYLRCILDQLHHTAVPVFGYLVGSFATLTVLMKNSLLENMGADYVRTAFAKGLPEKRVIFVHAMRNSLIPLTAQIGYALGILFAGSFLIEKTCNISGMGLLGFSAIQARDYPIILGTLVFLVLIRLVGNIISDLVWALIDPRIRFQ